MNIKRAFLVGCPRSGTTLLQSMIASHSQVVSFPETHFFSKTLPINNFLRQLKIHGPKSRKIINQFLQQNGYDDLQPFKETAPYHFFTYSKWCRILLSIIDEMTARHAEKQKNDARVVGLEKTPRHLHYISSIEKSKPPSNFIHILRDGSNVVASLYLATKQYPDQWGGQRSIRKCISWWNKSIEQSLRYVNKPNHCFVTYEQLISDPERVLKTICTFLNLDYDQSMIQNFHRTAGYLTQEEEAWKNKNTRQSLRQSDKLTEHFDASTIAYIQTKIKSIDLQQFFH